MDDLQRQRVRQRLDDINLNAFEAASIGGFQRNYFHDLLIGKKQSIRGKWLSRAAQTLQCDPDYLLGRQDTPRKGKGLGGVIQRGEAPIKLSGFVEAGVWLDPNYELPDYGPMPVDPDPRYSPDDQKFYIVRGDHASGLGILAASVLCVVSMPALEQSGRKLHEGDIVLVRQKDGAGRYELSARVIEDSRDGVRLSAKPLRGELPPLKPGEGVEIDGLILRTIRVFGMPV